MSVAPQPGDLTASATLVRRPAQELLHGCVAIQESGGGWVRPQRFSDAQIRALGSVSAWHPGLYRAMARATAGISLELETDSSELALELQLDPEPAGTRAMLDHVTKPVTVGVGGKMSVGDTTPSPHDGFGIEVDGRLRMPVMPQLGMRTLSLCVDDPEKSPAAGVTQLPGLGAAHRVRIWLPCLRGCALRSVVGNGTKIEALPMRRQLLVLGDSIAQGFVCGDPGQSWPALLARDLDLDLVNQGIGGQVFQPGTLVGLRPEADVALIVVALGANYRYEPCQGPLVARDIRLYLDELSRLWPKVPTYVADPLWHDEEAWPSHPKSCWKGVKRLIAQEVARHKQMRLVKGSWLLDHKRSLLADGFEHPNAEGMHQIAERLSVVIVSCETSSAELRARGLATLRDAPRRTFPLTEMLRRDIGKVEFAREGCVLVRTPDGIQTLWAGDATLGRSVIRMLVHASVVVVLEPALVRDVKLCCGLMRVDPYRLAILTDKKLPKADVKREVRQLDESYFDTIWASYGPTGYASERGLHKLLQSGGILGGFKGDELVGFVGEHPCGSIGMLTVFDGHRRHGWAQTLLLAKIREHMDRGWTPWAEVYPDNRASVSLMRRVGMSITSANEQCYLSADDEGADMDL